MPTKASHSLKINLIFWVFQLNHEQVGEYVALFKYFPCCTGQRCRGRNYEGKRCCTPKEPCDEGEGDCDGPGDGGQHDGHAGCTGDLVCGSNNCLKFGLYYHEKDDCCEKNGASVATTTRKPNPRKPINPPEGKS